MSLVAFDMASSLSLDQYCILSMTWFQISDSFREGVLINISLKLLLQQTSLLISYRSKLLYQPFQPPRHPKYYRKSIQIDIEGCLFVYEINNMELNLNIIIMNFPSCNRLIFEKQLSMKNKLHKLKLSEIRNRLNKSLTKQLHRRSASLVDNKKETDIEPHHPNIYQECDLLSKGIGPNIKQHKLQISYNPTPQPYLHRSSYSIYKISPKWKQSKQHSSSALRHSQNKEVGQVNQISNEGSYSYQCLFDDHLKMFDSYGLEMPGEDEFKEPENMAERVIVFKKSVLVAGVPYLIEISSAYRRVFVIAYYMGGSGSRVLRMTMSQSKARTLFSQYEYDFAQIVSRINIERNRVSIKLPPKQEDPIEQPPNDKVQLQKQNQFITRNYYSFIQRHRVSNPFYQTNGPTKESESANQEKGLEPSSKSKSNINTLNPVFKISHRKRFSLASTVKKLAKTTSKMDSLRTKLDIQNGEQQNERSQRQIQLNAENNLLKQKDNASVYTPIREDFVQKVRGGSSIENRDRDKGHSAIKGQVSNKKAQEKMGQYLQSFQH